MMSLRVWPGRRISERDQAKRSGEQHGGIGPPFVPDLDEPGQEFSQTLSVSQKNPFELLLEWWNGDIDKADTRASVRDG